MRDLDEIRLDVTERQVVPLVDEAIRAYSAGALRSSIVSLWIAVSADLIFKIRHLADTGDGEAGEAVRKLDKAIEDRAVRRLQEFENSVLELCAKLEIFTHREVVEMTRLYEDRNLCAHPGFVEHQELYTPTAEAVRAHIVGAAQAVFSQQPIAGKRLVSRLMEEIASDAWPMFAEVGDYVFERFFASSRASVRRNALTLLVKGSIRPPNGSSKQGQRCRDAARLVREKLPEIHDDAVAAVIENWERNGGLQEADLLRACGAFGYSHSFWKAFPGTARVRLVALLGDCDVDMLVEHRFFASGVPADPEIGRVFRSASMRLNGEQLARAIRSARNRADLIPAVVERLKNSASYIDAEDRALLLVVCAKDLKPEHVANVKFAIEQNARNQIRLARDVQDILIRVFEGSPKSEEHLENWLALAEWLNQVGIDEGNADYTYDRLLNKVTEAL